MTITHENVTPSLIENTTMQKRLYDGVHKSYTITPNENYVLHDKTLDGTIIDEETGEETVILGFYPTTKTCGANYDFTVNPREFYAVLRSEVPEDQIFGDR